MNIVVIVALLMCVVGIVKHYINVQRHINQTDELLQNLKEIKNMIKNLHI